MTDKKPAAENVSLEEDDIFEDFENPGARCTAHSGLSVLGIRMLQSFVLVPALHPVHLQDSRQGQALDPASICAFGNGGACFP